MELEHSPKRQPSSFAACDASTTPRTKARTILRASAASRTLHNQCREARQCRCHSLGCDIVALLHDRKHKSQTRLVAVIGRHPSFPENLCTQWKYQEAPYPRGQERCGDVGQNVQLHHYTTDDCPWSSANTAGSVPEMGFGLFNAWHPLTHPILKIISLHWTGVK